MARLSVGSRLSQRSHLEQSRRARQWELGRVVAAAEPDPRLRERLRDTHRRRRGAGEPRRAARPAGSRRRPRVRRQPELGRARGPGARARTSPVMVEKPMAADSAGAEALLARRRAAGQPLMVNWPTAWRPAIRHGLDLVRAGAVGLPVQLSHRGGHAGPAGVRLLAPVLRLALRPRAQRRRRAGRLLRIRGHSVPRDPRAAGRRHGRLGAPPQGGPSRRGQRHRRSPVSARPGRPRGELDADRRRAGIRHDPSTATPAPCSFTSRGRRARAAGRGADRCELVTGMAAGGSIRLPCPPISRTARPTSCRASATAVRVEGLCAPEVGRDVQEILGPRCGRPPLGREVPLAARRLSRTLRQGGPRAGAPAINSPEPRLPLVSEG